MLTETASTTTTTTDTTSGMSSLANVWDWDFFWGSFGFFLTLIASFIMLIVAIHAVGILLKNVIAAIRQRG